MARWYVTDGSTITELPPQLEPTADSYFPPLDLAPFRPPGGTTLYYEGDGLPQANWLTLTGGVLQAGGGYALYQSVAALNAALATATHLKREETDGTLSWGLKVGASHVIDAQPIEKRSNVWRVSIRCGLGSGALAVTEYPMGGSVISDSTLKAWVQAEAYEATSITRNALDVVTTAAVLWPDGSAGTFTSTSINATWNTVDAFTITHAASGKTITQSAVTRNGSGAVTVKPALIVTPEA